MQMPASRHISLHRVHTPNTVFTFKEGVAHNEPVRTTVRNRIFSQTRFTTDVQVEGEYSGYQTSVKLGRAIWLLVALLLVLLISSRVGAESGFFVPCVDVGGGGLEVRVSSHPIRQGLFQVTRVEYIYYAAGLSLPPTESIAIERHASQSQHRQVLYRIISGSSVGLLQIEVPELPIHWQLRLIGLAACRQSSRAMRGVIDWAVQGSQSLFSDSMNTMFDFLDIGGARTNCWEDFEFLLGDQIGAIRGTGTPVAQRDGTRCATGNPVSLYSGAIQLRYEDLVGLRNDGFFGHRRSYVHQISQPYNGPNGYNWHIRQAPYLIRHQEGHITFLVVSFDGNRTAWFRDTGSSRFESRFGESHVRLRRGDGVVIFTVQGTGDPLPGFGVTEYEFHDFDAPLDRRGLLKQYTDTTGSLVQVSTYRAGQIESLARTLPNGVKEQLWYTYDDVTHRRRLRDVTYTRLPAGSPDQTEHRINVSRAVYTYYEGLEEDGSRHDLKMVTTQHHIDGRWADTTRSYYRYWTVAQADFSTRGILHGLKYAVGPAAYQRMVKAGVSDPTAATEAQIAAYADHYFEYDPVTKRVVKEIASAGCLGCVGLDRRGTTGDTFTYEDNNDSRYTDGYNYWKRKTSITYADGSVETVYMNHAGQVILRIIDGDGPLPSAHFYEYDNQGRQVLAASSSAIDLQSLPIHQHHLDLLNKSDGHYQYLKDGPEGLSADEGMILLTQYDPVSGHISDHQVQKGELGVPVTIETFEYTEVSINGHTLYPLKQINTYPAVGGPAVITQFDYHQWHAEGTEVRHQTTTLPIIPRGQNGSGQPATIEQMFNTQGRVIWQKDERGTITHFKYSVDMNLLEQRIDDVDMTRSDLPVDKPVWRTPAKGGKHLRTDFAYDDLGRLKLILGVAHEAQVETIIQRVRPVTWFYYTINGPSVDDQVVIASGFIPVSDVGASSGAVVIDPMTVRTHDKTGQLTCQITMARAPGMTGPPSSMESDDTRHRWRSWTTVRRNANNTIQSVRVYHRIPHHGVGIPHVHYEQTIFAYDSMGRRSRIVEPEGTITRLLYDRQGRVTEVWIGTDDGSESGDWDKSQNVNMTLVSQHTYNVQGDLTQTVSLASQTETRQVTYTYDWRHRRTGERHLVGQNGETDHFFQFSYDNIGRRICTERYDASDTLTGRHEVGYDNLGRVYRTTTYAVDPSTGAVGPGLARHSWYDPAGYLVKQQEAGTRLWTKHAYDRLGRRTASYTGYGSDVNDSQTHVLISDTVLEQLETEFNDTGHVLRVTRYQRNPTLIGPTGSLNRIQARVVDLAFWYDGTGRLLASAHFGSHEEQAKERPAVVPERSDTVLISSNQYNDAGQVAAQTDPQGIKTQFVYDHAGRVTEVIENGVENQSVAGGSDGQRVTQISYTPDGQVRTHTAKMDSSSTDQVTTYIYGVDFVSGSGVASNKLLHAIIYPDSDDPSDRSDDGIDGQYDRIEMKYNRLGQIVYRKDQRGVIRRLEYDPIGRLLHDRVTETIPSLMVGQPGALASTNVRRITRRYDTRGLLQSITSHDDANPNHGAVLNEVTFEYNGFNQLVRVFQAHEGNRTDDSLSVDYQYEDGSDPVQGIRQTGMAYPNGREINLNYDGPDPTNHITSRVGSVIETHTGVPIVSYGYLGLNTVVQKTYPSAGVRLAYHNSSDVGKYDGWDRFGRIILQKWVRDHLDRNIDLFHIEYTYDRAGNRLSAHRQFDKHLSQTYLYDNLRRLTGFYIGDPTQKDAAGLDNERDIAVSFCAPSGRQWTLDRLGNPTAIVTRSDNAQVTSSYSRANEIRTHRSKGSVGLTERWLTSCDTIQGVDIDPVTDRLVLRGVTEPDASESGAILLRGVYVSRFEAIFSAEKLVYSDRDSNFRFVFNVTDQDQGDYVPLRLVSLKRRPGPPVRRPRRRAQATQTNTNFVDGSLSVDHSQTTWFRITCDGESVCVYAQTSSTQPIVWDRTRHLVFLSSVSGKVGGMIGFARDVPSGQGIAVQGDIAIDNLTLQADRVPEDGDGLFETTEHIERFTVDDDGYGQDTLVHDAAGNLVYDGLYAYTYDAWNRLTAVTKAFRDTHGQIQHGSTVAVMAYDGLDRRITKILKNSASFNATNRYYYDGPSVIETRNGDNQVVSHHLWGHIAGRYVDDLVQLTVNADPIVASLPDSPVHNDFDRYYALQDANFNVLGLVNSDGALIERYSYSPYGERKVCVEPVADSSPLSTTNVDTGRSVRISKLNEFGHQGLMHDQTIGLVYNRARMLHPRLARFMQRDPLGYVDGSNLYQYELGNPITRLDPLGTNIFEDLSQSRFRLVRETSFAIGGALGFFGREAFQAGLRGQVGGVNIVGNTFTFGLTDYLELTQSHCYQGRAFAYSRAAATIAREAGITAATLGTGTIIQAGRGGVLVHSANTTLKIRESFETGLSLGSGIQNTKQGNIGTATLDFAVAGLAGLGAIGDGIRGVRGVDRVTNVTRDVGPTIDPARLLRPSNLVDNAGGKITSFVTQQDQLFFRVFSGNAARGQFLTAVPPQSSAKAIEGLALPPGNNAEFIQEVLVPSGTRLQRSRALPAFGHQGGREQFELLDIIPEDSFRNGIPFK